MFINVLLLFLFSTGKKGPEMKIPSGDADVNEPSTLGKIRDRLSVLLIGGVRRGGGGGAGRVSKTLHMYP